MRSKEELEDIISETHDTLRREYGFQLTTKPVGSDHLYCIDIQPCQYSIVSLVGLSYQLSILVDAMHEVTILEEEERQREIFKKRSRIGCK